MANVDSEASSGFPVAPKEIWDVPAGTIRALPDTDKVVPGVPAPAVSGIVPRFATVPAEPTAYKALLAKGVGTGKIGRIITVLFGITEPLWKKTLLRQQQRKF